MFCHVINRFSGKLICVDIKRHSIQIYDHLLIEWGKFPIYIQVSIFCIFIFLFSRHSGFVNKWKRYSISLLHKHVQLKKKIIWIKYHSIFKFYLLPYYFVQFFIIANTCLQLAYVPKRRYNENFKKVT